MLLFVCHQNPTKHKEFDFFEGEEEPHIQIFIGKRIKCVSNFIKITTEIKNLTLSRGGGEPHFQILVLFFHWSTNINGVQSYTTYIFSYILDMEEGTY